jgi:transposase
MTQHKKKRRQTGTQPQPLEVRMEEIAAALARTRALLSPEDHALFSNMVDTLAWVTAELQTKGASIERLRNMIFGARSEKTRDVLAESTDDTGATLSTEVAGAQAPCAPTQALAAPRAKAPGHGKNGAVAYTGATQVSVAHPHLHSGEACPGCTSGKLYPQSEPAKLVRITGVAPLSATVYERERLRCNLCGEVYTAPSPAGVGEEKYDATATSMVGLFK